MSESNLKPHFYSLIQQKLHLSSAIARCVKENPMKFYFCEACGKRVTEEDIREGQGADKKLKGVFCKACSVGVMTMETVPLTQAEAKEIQEHRQEQGRERTFAHRGGGLSHGRARKRAGASGRPGRIGWSAARKYPGSGRRGNHRAHPSRPRDRHGSSG